MLFFCLCEKDRENFVCVCVGGGGEGGLNWVISSLELQTLAHTLPLHYSSTPLTQSKHLGRTSNGRPFWKLLFRQEVKMLLCAERA